MKITKSTSLLILLLSLLNWFVCGLSFTFVSGLSSSITKKSSTGLGMTKTYLEQLAGMTKLSIDSGDLDILLRYKATNLITDATTNPLFVSQAGLSGDARYAAMVDEAIHYAKVVNCKSDGCDEDTIGLVIDRLAVNLGAQIAKLVPGRVSTEVDIRLSYDTENSIARAKRIIELYKDLGVPKERVLIKLAGTWEGIQVKD